MENVYCTLYNSLYLDKGLVLYKSLKQFGTNPKLYVLCMDDKCYEVLRDQNDEYQIPICLQSIENDRMKIAKQNRTTAEYCWTCSSRLIQYVLETYSPDTCTYIDADMCFFNDPTCLLDEMLAYNKSVMVVPHRFPLCDEHKASIIGTYCVEFNTFVNNDKGKGILEFWHSLCLECCRNIGDGIHWGDQKYLDRLVNDFPEDVYVCKHLGAGIAPWNIMRYAGIDNKRYTTTFKDTDTLCDIVFYHYQALSYIGDNWVETGVSNGKSNIDYLLVDSIYKPYLAEIEKVRLILSEKYNLNLIVRHHPSSKNYVKYIIKQSPIYRFLCNAFLKKILVYSPYYIDKRTLSNS